MRCPKTLLQIKAFAVYEALLYTEMPEWKSGVNPISSSCIGLLYRLSDTRQHLAILGSKTEVPALAETSTRKPYLRRRV